MDYIIVFFNTHQALMFENMLNNNKIDITVLPTPSYISNSCGISIAFSNEKLIKIKELINNNKDIIYKFIYDMENQNIIN